MLCTLHLFTNNNTMKYTISLLCICFYATLVSAQSPWTHTKDGGYAQVAFTNIGEYSEIFGDPDYESVLPITDRTLQLYAEYGLIEGSTLILNVPIKMISFGSSDIANEYQNTSRTAIGNVGLAWKQKIADIKGWTLSGIAQFDFKVDILETSAIPAHVGYVWHTISPMFAVGKGWDKAYIQLFTGMGFRLDGWGRTNRMGGEVGYKLLSKLWGAFFIDVVETNIQFRTWEYPLFVPNEEYAAYGFKFIGELGENWGLNLGLGGAFYGRNVAKAPAITFGVYTKW